MTIAEEILLAFIDTFFLGVLILLVGYVLNRKLEQYKDDLNRSLEQYKSDLEWNKKIAEARTQAYRELWSLTRSIGGTGSTTTIEPEQRKQFSTMLSTWYWEKGNGLYLSHATMSLLMAGWELLKNPKASDQQIRDHFSSIRTHLKRETGVYSEAEARKSVG